MMPENESVTLALSIHLSHGVILELRGTPRILFGRKGGGADAEAI